MTFFHVLLRGFLWRFLLWWCVFQLFQSFFRYWIDYHNNSEVWLSIINNISPEIPQSVASKFSPKIQHFFKTCFKILSFFTVFLKEIFKKIIKKHRNSFENFTESSSIFLPWEVPSDINSIMFYALLRWFSKYYLWVFS